MVEFDADELCRRILVLLDRGESLNDAIVEVSKSVGGSEEERRFLRMSLRQSISMQSMMMGVSERAAVERIAKGEASISVSGGKGFGKSSFVTRFSKKSVPKEFLEGLGKNSTGGGKLKTRLAAGMPVSFSSETVSFGRSRKCSSCGAPLVGKEKVCGVCGQKIRLSFFDKIAAWFRR